MDQYSTDLRQALLEDSLPQSSEKSSSIQSVQGSQIPSVQQSQTEEYKQIMQDIMDIHQGETFKYHNRTIKQTIPLENYGKALKQKDVSTTPANIVGTSNEESKYSESQEDFESTLLQGKLKTDPRMSKKTQNWTQIEDSGLRMELYDFDIEEVKLIDLIESFDFYLRRKQQIYRVYFSDSLLEDYKLLFMTDHRQDKIINDIPEFIYLHSQILQYIRDKSNNQQSIKKAVLEIYYKFGMRQHVYKMDASAIQANFNNIQDLFIALTRDSKNKSKGSISTSLKLNGKEATLTKVQQSHVLQEDQSQSYTYSKDDIEIIESKMSIVGIIQKCPYKTTKVRHAYSPYEVYDFILEGQSNILLSHIEEDQRVIYIKKQIFFVSNEGRILNYIYSTYIQTLLMNRISQQFNWLKEIGMISNLSKAVEYIALSILKILINLHKCGYVYGDLKPSNIIIDRNKVVLIDLGTVQKLTDNHNSYFIKALTPLFASDEHYFMFIMKKEVMGEHMIKEDRHQLIQTIKEIISKCKDMLGEDQSQFDESLLDKIILSLSDYAQPLEAIFIEYTENIDIIHRIYSALYNSVFDLNYLFKFRNQELNNYQQQIKKDEEYKQKRVVKTEFKNDDEKAKFKEIMDFLAFSHISNHHYRQERANVLKKLIEQNVLEKSQITDLIIDFEENKKQKLPKESIEQIAASLIPLDQKSLLLNLNIVVSSFKSFQYMRLLPRKKENQNIEDLLDSILKAIKVRSSDINISYYETIFDKVIARIIRDKMNIHNSTQKQKLIRQQQYMNQKNLKYRNDAT